MGRISKDSVDYFRHFCKPGGGRTKRLLFKQFGHEGLSCWFELLEVLGDSDGHYVDINDDIEWLNLLEILRIDEETGMEIFNFLARIGKIDGDLLKCGVVWCQNLVDNVQLVYKKRGRELPKKPHRNEVSKRFCAQNSISGSENGFSGSESTHRKAEKSREKKSKEKQRKENEISATEINGSLLSAVDRLLPLPFEDIHSSVLYFLARYDNSNHPGSERSRNKMADELTESYNAEYIKRKLQHFMYLEKFAKKKLGKNPAAHLIARIKDDYEPPANYEEWLEQIKKSERISA